MQFFLNLLQEKVQERKNNDYAGVYQETYSILRYIYSVNYLRKPQIDAFETYVYLKEIVKNKPLVDVCIEISDTKSIRKLLFSLEEREEMEDMDKLEKEKMLKNKLLQHLGGDNYSNQVYALTMGTGKTVLMTVFMLYDIVLSYYHPNNDVFAKNFLVFAPDKTIIQSLKEIKDFDYKNVIPPEYHNALLQIKYHYLEDTKQQLGLSEGSNYNIIITNSQKIIVKTRKGNKNDLKKSLLGDEREREQHQIENQRLMMLKRLDNLSVFVDEAHHSFGTNLEGELKKTKETINVLHGNRNIVNCVNLTGTPYVEGEMIANVVCYYGLKQGIEDGILKELDVIEFGDVKDDEFLKLVIQNFWQEYGNHSVENKKAKIAIYSANIEELQEVRRKLETDILKKLHIPTNIIAENHEKATKENQKEFLILDTPESTKQIILLVNKGTEGRNCKSLFATALYRKPPAIFTLQSTSRCLRSIGDNSKRATIFLSKENYKMLDKELKQNYGVGIVDVQSTDKKKQSITCTVEKRKEVKIKKVIKEIIAINPASYRDININFAHYKGKEIYIHYKTLAKQGEEVKYTEREREADNIQKSVINASIGWYEILGYLHRHTHIPFNGLKEIFSNNDILIKDLVQKISNDNYLLDFLVDEIVSGYYQYEERQSEIIETLQLVKKDVGAFVFEVDSSALQSTPKLVVYREKSDDNRLGFHLNPYNFDSTDELELFSYIRNRLKNDEHIEDVYFTGSGTEKYSDFFFEYALYEEGRYKVKKYFPDLLVDIRKSNGSKKYLVIEVKGSDKKREYDQAKELYKGGDKRIVNEVFAKEIGFQEFTQHNKEFEYRLVFDAKIPSKKEEVLKEIRA